MVMKMDQSTSDNELLGLPPLPTPQQVKDAWKLLRTKLHPDHGGSQDEFDQAKQVYERTYKRALVNFNGRADACRECLGTGKKKIVRGFYELKVPCNICKGTGAGVKSNDS